MAILYQPKRTLVDGSSTGELYIKREQLIPEEFLAHCKALRDASTLGPMGEMHKAVSLPTEIYDAWLIQGFDAAKVHPREVIARLKKEGLDAFITTNRTI